MDNVTAYFDIKHYIKDLIVKKDHVYVYAMMSITIALDVLGDTRDTLFVEIKRNNLKYKICCDKPVTYHVHQGDEIRILIDKYKPNMFLYRAILVISAPYGI